MKHDLKLRQLLCTVGISVTLLAPLRAATLTWDASGTNPAAPTGGVGTWSSTNLNWSNGVSDVGWTSGADNAIFLGTGGTVTLGAPITVNNITVNTTGYTIAGNATNRLTLNGSLTSSVAATLTAPLSGTNGFTKLGSGTITLNASTANTYTGNTIIGAGILQTRSANSLPAATTLVFGTGGANTATLDVRASQTVAGLSVNSTGVLTIRNTQTVGVTTLTVNPSGGAVPSDSTFTGNIQDGDATHNLALTKAGSNTLTLSGTNSYTGNTTISGGALLITSGLTGTASVTVSGGTLSSGSASGNLALGTGDVSMSSGAITPGIAGAGVGVASFTLAANRNLIASGGTFNFQLGTTYDSIIGSGTGTFSLTNTTLALDISTIPGFSYASTYTLFNGFNSGTSTALGITGYDAVNWLASLNNSGQLSFAATVPEPSTYALLGMGLVSLWSLRRRSATKV